MLRPLNDNVILKKIKSPNVTSSGIIVSSHENNEDGEAIVYAVGKGVYQNGVFVPIDLKVNDRVIFKKYSTTKTTIDDEEYLIVNYKDIIAVIE